MVLFVSRVERHCGGRVGVLGLLDVEVRELRVVVFRVRSWDVSSDRDRTPKGEGPDGSRVCQNKKDQIYFKD